jgi:hypothetical protein
MQNYYSSHNIIGTYIYIYYFGANIHTHTNVKEMREYEFFLFNIIRMKITRRRRPVASLDGMMQSKWLPEILYLHRPYKSL